MFLSIDGRDFSSLHFAGIMGSGMSAVAQFLAWSGHKITGSDRIAFADEMKEMEEMSKSAKEIFHTLQEMLQKASEQMKKT